MFRVKISTSVILTMSMSELEALPLVRLEALGVSESVLGSSGISDKYLSRQDLKASFLHPVKFLSCEGRQLKILGPHT